MSNRKRVHDVLVSSSVPTAKTYTLPGWRQNGWMAARRRCMVPDGIRRGGEAMTESDETAIGPDRIGATEQIIRPFLRRTPVVEADGADFGLDPCRLWLKLELLQHSGS